MHGKNISSLETTVSSYEITVSSYGITISSYGITISSYGITISSYGIFFETSMWFNQIAGTQVGIKTSQQKRRTKTEKVH